MSFLCNFPLYSKKTALETETLFSIDLPTKKKSKDNFSQNETISTYSNENEIKFNKEEQKKVIYVKNAETFDLTLQISGQTILQNLILTAKASHNGDPTPIKCQWRRIKSESERINIKNINSLSYMPNAHDIGFCIEVEVESLDEKNDIAIARYGKIEIDREMENIITELISYEKKCFNLKFCNENEKITNLNVNNNNYILELGKREIKLINIDQKGKKLILERCKYSQVNPSLELSNTNVTKFKISFIQFNNIENEENNNNNDLNKNDKESSNNISFYTEEENDDLSESELKRKDYEFLAMSKQYRELIYIIIQYNVINIKIKNSKIFRAANYNTLSLEQKNGIIKLIGDLKIHKEQNTIMLKNMKYLEYVNQQLNDEYSTLEENYKITMDKINGRDPNYKNIIKSNNGINNKNYSNNNNYDTNNSFNFNEDDWKSKVDELKNNYNSLLAKEKAIKEEKIILVNKDNNNLKLIEENNREIEEIKNKNNLYEKELESYNKNLSILNEDNTKIKKNCIDIEKEINILKDKNNKLLSKMKNNNKNNSEKIKMEIKEIKKNNENLNYENKNLIMQKNMLTNQKNDINKEIEKIKKEKEAIIRNINNIKLKKNNKKINNDKKDKKIIEDLKNENNNLQKEFNKIKDDYQYLLLENINLKETYENENKNKNKLNMSTISANTSMMGYQISPEEYENLRKNKDENDALIMQLKTNNAAQEVEINELKEKINKIKKRNKIL